ncbi:MAG TPA: hypothetical protein VF614_00065 [Chthoniobacteraceae bacterium]|jgi:hypothetical protein
MRRRKLYNPADYHPAANPSLARTNSPWRIWGLLLLAAVACFAALHFLRGPVRVSRPALELSENQAVATSTATNDTYHSVRLSLRFVLAKTSAASDARGAYFGVIEQRDIEVFVPSRSAETVQCVFPLKKQHKQLTAEVEILSRR